MKIFHLLIFLILLGCSKSDNLEKSPSLNAPLVEVIPETSNAKKEIALPSPKEEPRTASKKIDTISKKLIKSGNMEIQIADIKKSQEKVIENLKKFNAYLQDERFSNSDTQESLNLMIRVPNQHFDDLINSFSTGMGSVISKNINVNDVTEEYTDVSIKLANKKIYLEKYRDLLKRASSTKDMMEIQEKIRGLEDEIDVAEGRLRFIDDRVNYSTLNLTLFKEKARTSVTSKIGFGSQFVDSVSQGWNSFVSFILGLVSLWPFFLLVPVIIFVFKKWKNRKKNKKD